MTSFWKIAAPAGRVLPDWQRKAGTLFGISAVSYAGLSVYGLVHMEIRYSACFYSVKGLLAGMTIAFGTFVCLGPAPGKTGGTHKGDNGAAQP